MEPATQNKPKRQKIKPEQGGSQRRAPKRITEKYLYNAGLAYLQRFPSSTENFRKLFMRRIRASCRYHTDQDGDGCALMLQKTIEIFIRQGLLDDIAYLKGMIHSLRSRGFSTQLIVMKLQQKGYARDDIRKELESYDDNTETTDAELLACLKLARRKKIGPFSAEEKKRDAQSVQKNLALLARKGFTFETAQHALALPLHEAEDILAAAHL